jgi:hypothetical protein
LAELIHAANAFLKAQELTLLRVVIQQPIQVPDAKSRADRPIKEKPLGNLTRNRRI